MSNSTQFKNLLITISEVYSEPFSQTKAKAWWSVLKEYPVSAMEEALKSHISCPDQGMYTPKPAHLIQHMTGSTLRNKEKIRFNCRLAWTDVEFAMSNGQSLVNNDNFDQSTKDALSIINLTNTRNLDMYDMKFIKRDFSSAYTTACRIGIRDECSDKLKLCIDRPLKIEAPE